MARKKRTPEENARREKIRELFWVFRHLHPSIARLFPTLLGIVFHEFGAVLQQSYQ